jgi:5-methylcytosine-specific restriction endonuclease McrA
METGIENRLWKCLVLNGDGTPWSVQPWQKVYKTLMKGNATILVEYPEPIRGKIDLDSGIQETFPRPAVVILHKRESVSKRRRLRYTRLGVFLRDKYKCSYCGSQCSYIEGNPPTVDHVWPQSKGGESTYENCVTCCQTCNGKKGRKTLEECGLTLLNKPYMPDYLSPARLMREMRVYNVHYWFSGMGLDDVQMFKDFAHWMPLPPGLRRAVLEWEP